MSPVFDPANHQLSLLAVPQVLAAVRAGRSLCGDRKSDVSLGPDHPELAHLATSTIFDVQSRDRLEIIDDAKP